MSLANAYVAATLPSEDLERSKKFYIEKLGLKEVKGPERGGVTFEAGKRTQLFLYKRGPTKADHTVASFAVDDIEKTVKNLASKGVVFEEYDMPEMGLKTVNGIAKIGDLKAAWFKDPDGNILGLAES